MYIKLLLFSHLSFRALKFENNALISGSSVWDFHWDYAEFESLRTFRTVIRNVLTNAGPPLMYKHISWRFRKARRNFHQIRPAFWFLKDIINLNTRETYLGRRNLLGEVQPRNLIPAKFTWKPRNLILAKLTWKVQPRNLIH